MKQSKLRLSSNKFPKKIWTDQKKYESKEMRQEDLSSLQETLPQLFGPRLFKQCFSKLKFNLR
jgi:hypothetical protein